MLSNSMATSPVGTEASAILREKLRVASEVHLHLSSEMLESVLMLFGFSLSKPQRALRLGGKFGLKRTTAESQSRRDLAE
jgi:hypothetical protein